MTLFDSFPAEVSAETMRGVHDVLRVWLKARTGLAIWYHSGAWRVVQEDQMLSGAVSSKEFKAWSEQVTQYQGYSYAECLKWILEKIDHA